MSSTKDDGHCPGECHMFLQRRRGPFGSFYHCHRCKNNIAESAEGGPSAPTGTCGICGGLMFPLIRPDGTKVNICWRARFHPGNSNH